MPNRSQTSSPDDRYKFTGKERDYGETGWDYFGARYYDSKIGRWLQVDPLADKYPGWSPYNYALNNPLRIFDPDGRDGWDFLWGIAKGFGKHIISTTASSLKLASDGLVQSVSDPSLSLQVLSLIENPSQVTDAVTTKYNQLTSDFGSTESSGEALGEILGVAAEVAVTKRLFSSSEGNLAINPFKGKSPERIGTMLENKGFVKKGVNPVEGEGSYLHPKSGNQYYIDKGGKYAKGTELPHVDVRAPKGSAQRARKYPLGDKLYEN